MDSGIGARTDATTPSTLVAAGGSLRPSLAEQSSALAQVNRRRGVRVWRGLTWLVEWAKVASLAVVLFLFVRAFIVEAYKIPSGSMERTILVGDFLLVNKLVYGATVPFTGHRLPGLEAPARGDIVVFEWPKDRRKNLIKRLLGLPGDTLAMRNGVLYVNGVASAEEYVVHTEPGSDPTYDAFDWQLPFVARTAIAAPAPVAARRDPSAHPSRDNWGPLTVPDRQYFVLGDNRDNSLDSRFWGFVPDSLLRGRPMVVYYSYAPDSGAPFSWVTGVRWTRLGTRVR
jgi:signal peptidase I